MSFFEFIKNNENLLITKDMWIELNKKHPHKDGLNRKKFDINFSTTLKIDPIYLLIYYKNYKSIFEWIKAGGDLKTLTSPCSLDWVTSIAIGSLHPMMPWNKSGYIENTKYLFKQENFLENVFHPIYEASDKINKDIVAKNNKNRIEIINDLRKLTLDILNQNSKLFNFIKKTLISELIDVDLNQNNYIDSEYHIKIFNMILKNNKEINLFQECLALEKTVVNFKKNEYNWLVEQGVKFNKTEVKNVNKKHFAQKLVNNLFNINSDYLEFLKTTIKNGFKINYFKTEIMDELQSKKRYFYIDVDFENQINFILISSEKESIEDFIKPTNINNNISTKKIRI
jgi:hypothetical protein